MRPSFSWICAELRHIKNVHIISDVVTKLKGMVAGWERVEAQDNLCMLRHF
jgi:hypothetical protein